MKETRRNFCREMAIAHANRLRKANGVLDQNLLIGEAFMIMFVNYFTDTYVFEAIDALKTSPLYKHDVKQLAKRVEAEAIAQNKSFQVGLGDNANWFADINLSLDDAFDGKMKRLDAAIRNELGDCKYPKVFSRLAIALMLCELAAVNIRDRINECKYTSPIITKLKYIDHERLRCLLTKLYEKIGVPESVQKDLTIRAIWLDIQKCWFSQDFLTKHLRPFDDQKDDTVAELREILSSNS